jgi:hypothetical protein
VARATEVNSRPPGTIVLQAKKSGKVSQRFPWSEESKAVQVKA